MPKVLRSPAAVLDASFSRLLRVGPAARPVGKKSYLRTPEYVAFVNQLKTRVQTARLSAMRAVNGELVSLYWDIGRAILEKQQEYGWGVSVVEDLSRDLRRAYPAAHGFSARSLWYMRRFFAENSSPAILQQAVAVLPPRADRRSRASSSTAARLAILQQLVAEIPWGQHVVLLDKVGDPAARFYYIRATARFGWSRNVLLNQIKARAFERSRSARPSRRAGGGSAQEQLQSGVPRHRARREGTRT